MREQHAILQTDKLCKTFSTGGIQQHVLKNLDIELYEGDFTVIMGASGSGKSTLLYVLSGMDQPTLGAVKYEGVDISHKKPARWLCSEEKTAASSSNRFICWTI